MDKERLFSIVFTHKKSPIEYREKIAIQERDLESILKFFKEKPFLDEVFILSTCNRTEFYFVSEEREKCLGLLKDFFKEKAGVELEYFEILSCEESILHIFEVAGGLDSMILGEPQILGQVKSAYNVALKVKSCGVILNQLLQKTIRCGKRVRSETEIGFGAVSVSFAVVELAKKIFGELEGKVATVVGIGEMGRLCVKHLMENGVGTLYLCNRTIEKAVKFSEEIGFGVPVSMSDMWSVLSKSQIIIFSTSAEGYIVEKREFEKNFFRNFPEIFMADIAIPRDVDPEISKIDGVFLFDIDDLKGVVEKNIERRRKEAKKAHRIILEETNKFMGWLRGLGVKDLVVMLRKKFLEIKEREIEKYSFKSDVEKEVAQRVAHSLTNKFLHYPLSYLKKVPYEDMPLYCEIIKNIFELEEDGEDYKGGNEGE